MAETYDVAILGSGPGGYIAAVRAGQLGLKTVLIEKDKRLGGACLHRGCIPTKSLLYTAELVDRFESAGEFGVDVGSFTLNFLAAQKRKEKVVGRLATGIDGLMKKYKVTVVKGHGRLAGKGKIEVAPEGGGPRTAIAAKNVVIATGSVPRDLPVALVDHRRIVNSDSILALEAVPKSLLVLGAGAVGMEFASIFKTFGAQVTVIEVMSHLLPLEDEDSSKEIEKAFRRRKIDYLLETKLEKVELGSTGVRATVKTGAESKVLEAEMLLSAVGRKPVTDDIGLETTGIKLERGYIPVDSMQRTTELGVYAIGDVVPTLQLAHVASHEGVVAVEHIAGKTPHPVKYERCPGATYTHPEVASVGLSEKKAREKGYDVRVGVFPMLAVGKAVIEGSTEGMIKIISDKKYDEVLGVHIVGLQATNLIAEACAALELEATTEDLIRTIHAHPTLAEGIGEAANAVYGHPLNF